MSPWKRNEDNTQQQLSLKNQLTDAEMASVYSFLSSGQLTKPAYSESQRTSSGRHQAVRGNRLRRSQSSDDGHGWWRRVTSSLDPTTANDGCGGRALRTPSYEIEAGRLRLTATQHQKHITRQQLQQQYSHHINRGLNIDDELHQKMPRNGCNSNGHSDEGGGLLRGGSAKKLELGQITASKSDFASRSRRDASWYETTTV